jgi:shikimate dehydrogenase
MRADLRYGLLGDPVAHSLSPVLYGTAFSFLEVPGSYGAHLVSRGDAEALRRMMRELGSSGGGNVTVPHKESAALQLDVRSAAVEATGACNCFWLDSAGRLVGDNTDVGGFLTAAAELEGLQLEGASVLLVGAGGAARAVAFACADAGVRRLTVRNRTTDRAAAMIADLGLQELAAVCPAREVPAGAFDLVVNATSLGLHADDELPLVLESGRFQRALDLVYGAEGTEWTRHAEANGIPATDGLSMLVHQAALSLERWLGEPPDRDGLVQAMRKAAEAAL